nr:alcohol dehydrogenase catalytic domain-containing protein [Natrinema sp. SYSU A 869]
MKAYEVQDASSDYEGVVQVERDRPTPDAGEALVRIRAASLNYRDLAIANDELAYPGASLPVVPLSDGAGEVVAVGDDVERLSDGDRVATPFAPDWIEGEGPARRWRGRPAATSTARCPSTRPSPRRASQSSPATSRTSRARRCRVPA